MAEIRRYRRRYSKVCLGGKAWGMKYLRIYLGKNNRTYLLKILSEYKFSQVFP